jgi:hypothetical protein
MKTTFNVRRYGILAAATVICLLAASVVANATFTLTVPNSATYIYNLNIGERTPPITPPPNQPVLLIGDDTSNGGVAQVTLEHIPGSKILWTGFECPPVLGNSIITSGSSATAGAHIVWLTTEPNLDVEVAGPDTILIQNSGFYVEGSITLIW